MKRTDPRHYITSQLLLGQGKGFGANPEGSVQTQENKTITTEYAENEGVPQESHKSKERLI